SARSVAAKKLVNGMPCSCSVIQRVNRIRLKPKKKKTVGGSTCFTCTSHQSKARRQSGAGVPEAVELDDVMASLRRPRTWRVQSTTNSLRLPPCRTLLRSLPLVPADPLMDRTAHPGSALA